ncbi:MAG: tRNA (adenosine(37)-N6)-dimethylallyltransferase MiaA [Treponema sp.]|nr:tRNA (adenosine(37)-N6)-dimethylallyltransferase MiaA [Treponema sp.]
MKKKTSSSKIPVIVIFAPTASGKTALTGDLFSPSGSHFVLNAEVISADSMQVYKYMDIGTAKADPEFCEKIPHHLINLVTPDVQFTVADFLKMADEKCEEIYTRGKLPVVVGGTGFYIRSFLFGLPETPESDENLRNQLKSRIETEGNEILYKELHSVDPESASKIHVNDAYRIVRALEVFYTTGKKRSDFIVEKNLRDKFDFLFIVLQPPRELLYERIRNRVDVMFQQGLVQEFNSLVERGYSKDTPGMKAIGYSEFFEYEDIETVKDRIKHDSCKYAKKQYTYIKDFPGSVVVEFTASDSDIKKVAEIISDFVQN